MRDKTGFEKDNEVLLCSHTRAKVWGWISEAQLWAAKIKGNCVPEKSWGSQLSGVWVLTGGGTGNETVVSKSRGKH